MATKKGGGSTKNLRDSNAQYLGVKRYAGQIVKSGEVLVRQRGTKMVAGKGTAMGKDHTIFAKIAGIVTLASIRKTKFDGTIARHPLVSVVEKAS